ncbi:universal stress protein [Aquabacter spiritensis]|uniref:Universal stress protein family protein n=1 Tax=Aquabacter spiritensis TaxID=933073 RepID=A0A4R3M4A4_9HYPH|nr:universal stress protein [Aquabacter spiritensis]TCT06187.1 universal stress protein family protein [Aquabacter spiritensis]
MLQGIKSVLVGVTEEGIEESASALGYALSLARQAGAHLTVQATSVRINLHHAVVSDFATSLIAAENRRIQALAEAVAERSRGEAEAAGVTCTVESSQLSYQELLKSFVAQARVNDLAVLDAETATVDVDRGLIENVLFESGHPLLLVPPKARSFSARRVVVAWDGSAHAARAMTDALPFLRAAEAVDLLCIVAEADLARTIPGADAATFLARHGVAVTENDLPAGPDGTSQTLLRYLERVGADLLVMGAYKKSLFWEWVAGGVTQSLLKANPVPMLMSH